MLIQLKKRIDRIIQLLLVVLMSTMVLNVLWQVFTRFIVNDPSHFTDELARFLLIWLGLIGSGYVAGQKMHLAIDYVLLKFSRKNQYKINLLINLLVFLFALTVLFIGGISLSQLTFELNQTSAALQVKLGYIYLALPICGLLVMFYSVVNAVELFNNNTDKG